MRSTRTPDEFHEAAQTILARKVRIVERTLAFGGYLGYAVLYDVLGAIHSKSSHWQRPAVATRGARKIGRAIVERFAAEGARVGDLDIDSAALRAGQEMLSFTCAATSAAIPMCDDRRTT